MESSFDFDRALEHAVRAVVFEQVRERLGIGEVVDYLTIELRILEQQFEHIAADAAEPKT